MAGDKWYGLLISSWAQEVKSSMLAGVNGKPPNTGKGFAPATTFSFFCSYFLVYKEVRSYS
jgi:hypothetical protein